MTPSFPGLTHTHLRVSSCTGLRQRSTLRIIPTQANIIEFNRYHGLQFTYKDNWDTWKEGLTQELCAEAYSAWFPARLSNVPFTPTEFLTDFGTVGRLRPMRVATSILPPLLSPLGSVRTSLS